MLAYLRVVVTVAVVSVVGSLVVPTHRRQIRSVNSKQGDFKLPNKSDLTSTPVWHAGNSDFVVVATARLERIAAKETESSIANHAVLAGCIPRDL